MRVVSHSVTFLPLLGIRDRIGAEGGVVGVELRPVSPLPFLFDEPLDDRAHWQPRLFGK